MKTPKTTTKLIATEIALVEEAAMWSAWGARQAQARLRKPLLLTVASCLLLVLTTRAYSDTLNGLIVSLNGTGPWTEFNTSTLDLEDFGFADFDGDGKTDVISALGGLWLISFGGTSSWQTLNVSDVPISDMRFGDFNNDGKADVFTTWGGIWRVSFSGAGAWQEINKSDVEVSDILLGDFNNDGKADVFTTWGGNWRVSFSGAGGWQVINKSDVEVSDILLGDFNNDGKADVFTTWGGKWHVSFSGTSGWEVINISDLKFFEVRFGDFNGDGQTDVFSSWGGKWHVSFSGTGAWQDLNNSDYGVFDLRFGDFDGNGKTDVFTTGEDKHIGLSIKRFTTANLTNSAADSILASATNVLRKNDGPGDNICLVHFVRDGSVGAFSIGDGSIDSQKEFDNLKFNLARVSVVNQINWCGKILPNTLGCAPTPGLFQAVIRLQNKDEGILWAHEYGHTRGLKHRNDPNAVMAPKLDATNRRVNSAECAAYHQ